MTVIVMFGIIALADSLNTWRFQHLSSVGGPLQVSQLLVLLAIGVVLGLRLWHGRTPLPLPSPLLWAVGLLGMVLLSTATLQALGGAFLAAIA